MWKLSDSSVSILTERTSGIAARIQRLEPAQAALRAEVQGERNSRLLAVRVVAAAEAASAIRTALEQFAQTMRAPPPRGRVDRIARARPAWRSSDGASMPEPKKLEACRVECELSAAGGRVRARSALRYPYGTSRPIIRS